MERYDGPIQFLVGFIQHYWVYQGNQRYPSKLADLTVTSVRDLTIGYDSSNPPSFKPNLPLSPGNMITFRAEDDAAGQEVILTIRYGRDLPRQRTLITSWPSTLIPVRTSGTEPKVTCANQKRLSSPNIFTQIKYYLEGQGKDTASLTTLLGQVIYALQEDWLEATKNGLLRPM